MTGQLPPLPGADVSPTELSCRDGARRFSNSEAQTFKRCRRKWWLAYYRSLKPRDESPVGPLAIGNRIHRALQYHYATRVPGYPAPIDAADALEVLIEADRFAVSCDLSLNDELAKKFREEADLERTMIEGYHQWLERTGDDANYEIVGAEIYREADVPEVSHDTQVKMIARLDLRVRRITDRAVVFLDHKTTTAFSQLTKTLAVNEQMLWYLLVELLAGDDGAHVNGALYNMLRKVKRTRAANPPFYERMSVFHNPVELENFLTRVRGLLTVMLTTAKRLDAGEDPRFVAYPTPTRDCPWDCPFYVPCRMMDDGSHVDVMLEREFEVGDPLAYYVRSDLQVEK